MMHITTFIRIKGLLIGCPMNVIGLGLNLIEPYNHQGHERVQGLDIDPELVISSSRDERP